MPEIKHRKLTPKRLRTLAEKLAGQATTWRLLLSEGAKSATINRAEMRHGAKHFNDIAAALRLLADVADVATERTEGK